jgi:uncharacterized lipoprotein YbaY
MEILRMTTDFGRAAGALSIEAALWPGRLWQRLAWLLVLAALALPGTAQATVIEGQASWRERLALPAGAVFQASLLDLSAPDGVPARVVARSLADPAGAPPVRFRFELAGDAPAIGARLAVSATVTHAGRLLFVTAAPLPLPLADARGQRPALDLRLVAVRRAAEASAASAANATAPRATPMRCRAHGPPSTAANCLAPAAPSPGDCGCGPRGGSNGAAASKVGRSRTPSTTSAAGGC